MYPRSSGQQRVKLQTFSQSHRVQTSFPKTPQADGKRDEVDKRLRSLVTQVSKDEAPKTLRRLDMNLPARHGFLLSPQVEPNVGRKTLVLDLDQTLVHSSFKPVDNADIVLPVEIEGNICYVYVLIRPGAQRFLEKMAPLYEIVIYTASLSKYAEPLLQRLDRTRAASFHLFREHCIFYNGVFVKDLSRLGRNLKDVIIVDNSPASYALNPDCALPSISWYDDMSCTQLDEMTPILQFLKEVDDVRPYLKRIVKNNTVNYDSAMEILRHQYSLLNPTPLPLASPKQPSLPNIQQEEPKVLQPERIERHTPLLNTWTPTAFTKQPVVAFQPQIQPFTSTEARPTTTGSSRILRSLKGSFQTSPQRGEEESVRNLPQRPEANPLRQSYDGAAAAVRASREGHRKSEEVKDQQGESQNPPPPQKNQRGSSTGIITRKIQRIPSSRKASSKSTNIIRKGIQELRTNQMVSQNGGDAGSGETGATETVEVKERKISLGQTRPLLINVNRPSTTKNSSTSSGRQRVQLHFTRASDFPSFTSKALKISPGSKKGLHSHNLTSGLIPNSTRAQTANSRQGGSLFDAFVNPAPPNEPSTSYPVHFSSSPLKYGNLLKLNNLSPDDVRVQTSKSEKWKRAKQKERMERRTLKMGTPKYGSANLDNRTYQPAHQPHHSTGGSHYISGNGYTHFNQGFSPSLRVHAQRQDTQKVFVRMGRPGSGRRQKNGFLNDFFTKKNAEPRGNEFYLRLT